MCPHTPPECPRISIIIPVYNAGPYLEECLDSLLSQTFQFWEAVCIDDGSSDTSPAILDSYAERDARFRVIHQENGGVSCARNRGLQEIRAPYLILVDADDWLDADALEQLDKAVRENPEDLVLYGHYFHEFHRDTPRTCLPWPSPSGPQNRREPLRFRSMTRITSYACDKMFRSSVIREHGMRFQEGVKIGEDLKFIMEYLGYSRGILFINRPFYHYRYGAGITGSHQTIWKRMSPQSLLLSLDVLTPLCAGLPTRFPAPCRRQAASALLYWNLRHRQYMRSIINGMPRKERRALLSRSVFPVHVLVWQSSPLHTSSVLVNHYAVWPFRAFLVGVKASLRRIAARAAGVLRRS